MKMLVRISCLVLSHCVSASLLAREAAMLPETTVLAERLGGSLDDLPARALAVWGREEIAAAAPRTLDELLAREPSFSLYRRQTAMFGNPTSAGVSLRNTGATAASRTLVLRDGIPQNDPFGGWVYWARYDPAALESLRIVPAARAVVWGNQSPAGVIQLRGGQAFDERHLLRVAGGSHQAASGSWIYQTTNEARTLALGVSAFGLRTDGFFAVADGQRGAVDRRLDLQHHGGEVRVAWRPVDGVTVEPMVSFYREDRGNGTPLARNATDALDVSLRVTSRDGPISWQVLGYHQQRGFESMFSSVDPVRAAELPALHQYDVPGRGSGGAWTMLWEPGGRWTWTGGADLRRVVGETNETVFALGNPVRDRRAGGGQWLAGLFVAAGYEADPDTRIDASLRADAWWLRDGERIERSVATGAVLREEFFGDRDGLEPSAALAVSRTLAPGWEADVSVGTSFRLPTLNELHRPFRVRNDIVEANPALDPERFVSVEAGLGWQIAEPLRVRGSLFRHWIRDAIANVPVTDAGMIADLFGVIPPGGSGSQRHNVEQARVLGVQAEIEWQAHESLVLALDGIWSDAEFIRSPGQPLLEGKPFPQAPDLRLIGSAEWRASPVLTLRAVMEYGAAQTDDALARRRIPSYTSAGIAAAWQVSAATLIHARVDNLFDREIATGLSSDGIRTIAGPRAFWLGVQREF
jgi:outer membrane cobalamin receptor